MNKSIKKFIKRNILSILLLIILILTCIVLIKSIGRDKERGKIQEKTLDVSMNVAKSTTDVRQKFFSFTESKKSSEQQTIENLRKENSQLRKELIKQTLQKNDYDELKQLKNVLNFTKKDKQFDVVSADIIAKNDGIPYISFTVSAGRKDGVTEDAIVANGDGLIGRVYMVSDKYAKAITLLDSQASVSFEILGHPEDTGIINQNAAFNIGENPENRLIKGYMFEKDSKIKKGDTIITSGLGYYPEGIPIGKVKKVIEDSQKLIKYIVVETFVDMDNLNKVSLLSKKD